MKTIKQWLKEGLSKEDYKKIKKNSKEYNWEGLCINFREALVLAFNWRYSADGIYYWEKIYDNNGSLKVIAKDVVGIPGAAGHNPSSKLVVTGRSLDMIVESVREDLLRRSQVGIEKYGTTLERDDINLEGWLNEQYSELLDAALYCKRAIIQLKIDEENGK